MSAAQTGLSTGYNAFRLALSDPAGDSLRAGNSYSMRAAQYSLLWDAYQNAIFDRVENGRNLYDPYLRERGLYLDTRPIYNLCADQVDFYAFHVYPGSLESTQHVQGLEAAIPLMGASNEMREAVVQCWQWSQWARGVVKWITRTAAMGDGFVKIVDDVAGGKVRAVVVNPFHVKEVDFSDADHITYLVEEYRAYDREADEYFTYKAIYDKDRFQTFKDDQPHGFGGLPPVYDNPYGFVPWVYCPHTEADSLPGRPALRGFRTLEEVNSLASRLDDYILTQANSPVLLTGFGKISVETGGSPGKNQMLILKGEQAEGTKHDLQGNLEISAAEARVAHLLNELKERNLEATMWARLREMGDMSGVAVRRLSGDVIGRLRGVSSNYDAASVSLFRQMTAIGGMRYREGKEGWAARTAQQHAFAPFNLRSYERGDLDFSIGARELIPDSDTERTLARLQSFQAYQAEVAWIEKAEAAGLLEAQLRDSGMTEEEIPKFIAEMRRRRADAQPEQTPEPAPAQLAENQQ